MDIKQLRSYYDQAKLELENFRSVQYDIYKHVIPGKNSWKGGDDTVGERTDLDIFNSDPVTSVSQFRDNLVSLTIPAGSKFFNIKPNNNSVVVDENVLENVSDVIFNQLNSSNFYQAISESFLDLAAGTGGFTVNFDKQNNILYFTSLDMSKVSFLEDHLGKITYVFKEFGMLNQNQQNLLFPDVDFQKDQNISIIECVYPVGNKFVYMITNSTFSKVYKMQETATNPFIIFRWSKRPSENRGRGILHELIGAIKMTNRMARDVMDATSLVIMPPVVTDNSSGLNYNNLVIAPGKIITVDNVNSVFKPFPTSPNLPFGYEAIGLNNAKIDKALMINVLGNVGGKELTATEVNARMQLAANILGAAYNRLQREMLSPMFDRIIDLLSSNGIIEPIDKDMMGNSIKVKLAYFSPIVNADAVIQAQKTMQTIQYIIQATGDPKYVAAGVKLDKIPYYAATAFGARMTLINSEDETKSNLEGMIKAMEQQKQAMMQPANPALNAPINTGNFPNV